MAAPDPVSSTARAFLRPAGHDRRNDQYVRRQAVGVPGARELAAWRSSPAVQHMGSLGIMFDVLRRQCGARRGRQRCRRRGHRDHGGQLQPTFRAEYGGLLRCRRCSRCLPASGQAGHRLGGCQVAWGARELRRRRPSQTPQWTPGRVPSAALPEAAAAFPSGLIVHVVVFCAGMNVSVVRSAGGGRWSNPPSPPGASRVRKGGPTSNI